MLRALYGRKCLLKCIVVSLARHMVVYIGD